MKGLQMALHLSRSVVVALSGAVLVSVLIAADQAWKNKQYSEWTEDDAKEVIAGSPWVKTITPSVEVKPPQPDQGRTGGRRRGGKIGKDGPGRGGRDSPVASGQGTPPED